MEDRVFQPTHIPYFFQLEKEPYKLGSAAIKVYGFIVLYLVYIKAPSFYFSKSQIAEICNLYVDTVKSSLVKLEELNLIYRNYAPHPVTGNSVKFTEIHRNNYHLLLQRGRGGSKHPGGEGSKHPPNNIINLNYINKENNKNKDLLKAQSNLDILDQDPDTSFELPF